MSVIALILIGLAAIGFLVGVWILFKPKPPPSTGEGSYGEKRGPYDGHGGF